MDANPTKTSARTEALFFGAVACLVALNVFVQNTNLGRSVVPGLDEGIYLYAAKLISGGALPYRDFFLSHPPLLFFGAAALLGTGLDMDGFHFLYTLWFFSLLVPVCYVARTLSRSAAAGLVAGLFLSTFTELVQWDARFFALRQASLPFFALALFFFYVRPRPVLAGLLLAAFALSVLSNVFVVSAWLLSLLLQELRTAGSRREWASRYGRLLLVFLVVTAAGYAATLTIPHAFEDLVVFQSARRFHPFAGRFASLLLALRFNAPFLGLGLIGSFLPASGARFFGVTNLLGGILIVLGARSFYPNYLSILAVSLAISAAILTGALARSPPGRRIPFMAEGLVASLLLVNAFLYLRAPLLRTVTPEFYEVVEVLKRGPGPILAFEPRLALYAGVELTPHYYVADPKFLRAMNKNLEEQTFLELVGRSNAIAVEPYLASFLDAPRWQKIAAEFDLVYRNGGYQVWVKRAH
ncbi:MAG: hypothetical protein ABIT01_20670 [Thermoanaerobaculia bacterium]